MTSPLVLEGVHHGYGGRPVLGGIDLSLALGELLAVLGLLAMARRRCCDASRALCARTRVRSSLKGDVWRVR